MPSIASSAPRLDETRRESEVELRKSMIKQVADAWRASDFAWLDVTADEYARTGAKTYSGKSRLDFFYGALHDQLKIAWPVGWYRASPPSCQCEIPDPAHYEEADNRWQVVRAKLNTWVAQAPDSSNAKLALVEMLLQRAWFYRGTGYAGSVPPEAWPLYSRYMEEARNILSDNQAIRTSDPEWFALMFSVAMSQSWPQSELGPLLQDLRTSGTLYAHAYQNAALLMLPKWGGSYEELESFARQVIADHGDEGLEIYARIYWVVGALEFPHTHADWSLMKRGFETMIQKYPEPFNLNGMAMFACAAGDGITFKEISERLGRDLDPTIKDCGVRNGSTAQANGR
jgi:hypothetical protein